VSALTKRLGFSPRFRPTTIKSTVFPTSAAAQDLEDDWERWLTTLFPAMVYAGFAERHRALWGWVWTLRLHEPSSPFVGVWPRGGGKSSSAELACVAVGARGVRHYVLYISETQEQADQHVLSIGGLLESDALARYYPALGNRDVNKYGSSRGWRRNRLMTAAGFTVDAIGLDTASRGIKIEDQRPDMMVLDDIDGRLDTMLTTEKKITTLTNTLLPAGSTDVAVLAMQNLIHADSVFSRLADVSQTRADFLAQRMVSGPFPAIEGLTTEWRDGRDVITAGVPTWTGQDLAACQHAIDTYGLLSFRRESQHDVDLAPADALWKQAWLDSARVGAPGYPDAPDHYQRVVVAVDPSTAADGGGDACGIIVAGLGHDRHAYILADLTLNASPDEWAKVAIRGWWQWQGRCPTSLVFEANQGGDMVRTTLLHAASQLQRDHLIGQLLNQHQFTSVHTQWGKAVRAEPVAALDQQQRVHHRGYLRDLERELTTWTTGKRSPNRLDAKVQAIHDLMPGEVAASGAPAVHAHPRFLPPGLTPAASPLVTPPSPAAQPRAGVGVPRIPGVGARPGQPQGQGPSQRRS